MLLHALAHDLDRLEDLVEPDAVAVEDVAVRRCRSTSKSTSSYARYGCALRRSQAKPVERRIGPVMLRARHSSVVMSPMPTVRSRQIGFSESSSSYSPTPRSTVSHSSSDALLPTVGKVGRDAAGPDEVVVHPQPGDVLEEAQHLFALAPAVEHHRHRADVHAVRRLEQQVRRHAVELDEHHADPRRARRAPRRRAAARPPCCTRARSTAATRSPCA